MKRKTLIRIGKTAFVVIVILMTVASSFMTFLAF